MRLFRRSISSGLGVLLLRVLVYRRIFESLYELYSLFCLPRVPYVTLGFEQTLYRAIEVNSRFESIFS